MIDKLTKFINYLFGKSDEIKDLEAKDALLAKTVLDIHRKRTGSGPAFVPLFSVVPIHAIDRENAIQSTEKRVVILRQVKSQLIQEQTLSREILDQHIPSVSGIKVVKEQDDVYIAYEGNGRLAALQKVFAPTDNITIEVEEYFFDNPQKIIRRMRRVRRLNELE